MLGLDGQPVHQSSSGWVPVYADKQKRLGAMSIGFLLKNSGESVVWRGPKKDGMIRQFLAEVRWGDLDWLVVDTPPGEFVRASLNKRARSASESVRERESERASRQCPLAHVPDPICITISKHEY